LELTPSIDGTAIQVGGADAKIKLTKADTDLGMPNSKRIEGFTQQFFKAGDSTELKLTATNAVAADLVDNLILVLHYTIS
jgi:hypothetical protein